MVFGRLNLVNEHDASLLFLLRTTGDPQLFLFRKQTQLYLHCLHSVLVVHLLLDLLLPDLPS